MKSTTSSKSPIMQQVYTLALVAAACVTVGVATVIGGQVGIMQGALQMGIALLCGGLAFALIVGSFRRINETSGTSAFARIIAVMVIVLLVTSAGASIKGLWLLPADGLKFVLENTGRITGTAAIILASLLSALQQDIYWISRSATQKMDERQLRDRRVIFEKSYRLAAFTALGTAWFFWANADSIVRFTHPGPYGGVDGQLVWVAIAPVVFIFALPLILAAWQRPAGKASRRPAVRDK